ncbi:hypothetical protein FOZ63_021326, partial [Perkinsus olseni]
VRFGFDVVGEDHRLRTLTDMADFIRTNASHSSYGIVVDEGVLESTEWDPEKMKTTPSTTNGTIPLKKHPFWDFRSLVFDMYNARRKNKHSCIWTTMVNAVLRGTFTKIVRG